jgi:hypothetical protein
MIDVTHNINKIFERLDQTILEITISASHFIEDKTFTKNSGAEVQKEIIVNQITIGGIL